MSNSDILREPDQLAGVGLPEFTGKLVGHSEAWQLLASLLGGDRVPGAILLHGPRGIGKATLAFELARNLLLRTGDERADQVRAQVAAGGHPNLQVLRREPRDTGKGFYSVIRVEDVRAAIEKLHKTRGRQGHRVVILDAIDDANASSANALLKILEEPPPQTLFLLISHRPGGLLPTIKSRCQSVALRPLDDSDVEAILRDAGAESGRLAHAVELAEGRPRRGFEALALADDGVLATLSAWLKHPEASRDQVHLGLADALAADKEGAEMAFARDMILNWIAGEARQAAIWQETARRLASANGLWEKANLLLADADSLNLDARQTLVVLFDAIRQHAGKHISFTEPT